MAPTSAASTTRAVGLKANWVGGRPPDDVASPAAPTSELASRASTRWATVERPRPVAAASSLRVRGVPSRSSWSREPAPSTALVKHTHLLHFHGIFCLTSGRSDVGSGFDGPWGTRGEAGRDEPSRPEQGDPTSMRSSRTRLGFAALAVTALTLGVACGDDDDDEAGSDTTAASGATTGDTTGRHDRRHHRRHDRRHHRNDDRRDGRQRARGRRRLRHRRQQHPRRQRLAGGDDLRGQGRGARQRAGRAR